MFRGFKSTVMAILAVSMLSTVSYADEGAITVETISQDNSFGYVIGEFGDVDYEELIKSEYDAHIEQLGDDGVLVLVSTDPKALVVTYGDEISEYMLENDEYAYENATNMVKEGNYQGAVDHLKEQYSAILDALPIEEVAIDEEHVEMQTTPDNAPPVEETPEEDPLRPEIMSYSLQETAKKSFTYPTVLYTVVMFIIPLCIAAVGAILVSRKTVTEGNYVRHKYRLARMDSDYVMNKFGEPVFEEGTEHNSGVVKFGHHSFDFMGDTILFGSNSADPDYTMLKNAATIAVFNRNHMIDILDSYIAFKTTDLVERIN